MHKTKRRVMLIALVAVVLFLSLSFWTPRGAAQNAGGESRPVANTDCVECHTRDDVHKTVDGRRISMRVDEAVLKESAHSELACTSCHKDVKVFPHTPAPVAVACDTCHQNVAAEYAEGSHARSRAAGNADAAGCTDCHGGHDIYPKGDHRSNVFRLKVADTCSRCHTDQRITSNHDLPSPEFVAQYRESIHGRRMSLSGFMIATCADCHGAHRILPHDDPASTLSHANAPETCNQCHADVFFDFQNSSHGQAWRAGNDRSPVCTTCHNAHEIRIRPLLDFRREMAAQCGNCHETQAPSYRDTFHGQATSLGYAASATCADCHTPHNNLPADDPRSTVNAANLMRTCGDCHGQIDAGFISYDPHPEPSNPQRSMVVYSTHTFMKWLFLVVFGFFGLHTVLWFQRSVVAAARGEMKRDGEDGRWVVRFATPHRVTHIVMVISFLGLAATGLPLMYFYTGWGQWLTRMQGGVEVTQFLHRVCGVITFGYFAYHVGYLLWRRFSVRDIRLFGGPNSMMVRWKDARDLFDNLRYFLYLGPPPKLDRWTYWEKFDYYAVFWGVPVIGLSGLMLWFPELVTRFLPGDVLNAAAIIHGEEALLATSFIFLFHFFHSHMRPENFPMDTVIFTGRMPLEKFKHERPAEYERLVAEGKLESVIVEPPSPAARRYSQWFGWWALSVGLFLIIAMFSTFVWYG